MAWGVPKIGANVIDATGNFDLVEPVGVAQGDLMIACIAYRGNAAITRPSGWEVAAPAQNSGDTDATDGIASGAMFYIVRGASAPDLTCVRTAGDVAYAKVISYSGVKTADPYDTGSSATQGSAGNTPTTATFNTATVNELIVAMVAYGDQYTVTAFDAATDPATASGATDTTTAPTAGTWIERFDANSNTGADTGIGIADAVRAAAGATGTIQATVSSASGRNVMMAAAFKMQQATLAANTGSYTVTGNAVSLKRGYRLAADAGVYSLTGNNVGFNKGYRMAADAGSYALTGNAITNPRTYIMAATAGSYAVSGNTAGLLFGHRMAVDAGSYALTGNDISAEYGRRLVADGGSYALTGNDAGLRKAWMLSADAGAYSLVGNDAALLWKRLLAAAAGSYIWNGNDAGLIYGEGGDLVMPADTGVYGLTGNNVGMRWQHVLTADAGNYAWTGNAAGLSYQHPPVLPYRTRLLDYETDAELQSGQTSAPLASSETEATLL